MRSGVEFSFAFAGTCEAAAEDDARAFDAFFVLGFGCRCGSGCGGVERIGLWERLREEFCVVAG